MKCGKAFLRLPSALLTPGGNHSPFPPAPTSLINVTHCQTILSLLDLLYPSTVVLPHLYDLSMLFNRLKLLES